MRKKVFYIKNKDLLVEIHKSKNSYCYYVTSAYSKYDLLVSSLKEIDDSKILEGKVNYVKNRKNSIYKNPEEVPDNNVVFRIITYSHIPENVINSRKRKNNENSTGSSIKLNFTPFKHYIIEKREKENFVFKEVGRSHWKGDLENGSFATDHGQISNNLALMLYKLVERYSQKSNWRGYTWVEDMKSQAILQLIENSLKFDEFKSNNPFAYFTCIVTNSFRGLLNEENKISNIKSEKMMELGYDPSFNYQIDHESNDI